VPDELAMAGQATMDVVGMTRTRDGGEIHDVPFTGRADSAHRKKLDASRLLEELTLSNFPVQSW
jgi:hypothetical protein